MHERHDERPPSRGRPGQSGYEVKALVDKNLKTGEVEKSCTCECVSFG